MHDDIGTVVDRLAHKYGVANVFVDNQRHGGALGNVGDRLNVVMTPPGLAIDSINIALVLGDTARSNVEISSVSAHTTSSQSS